MFSCILYRHLFGFKHGLSYLLQSILLDNEHFINIHFTIFDTIFDDKYGYLVISYDSKKPLGERKRLGQWQRYKLLLVYS